MSSHSSSHPQITVAPRSQHCPRCIALTSIVAYHLPRINTSLNSLRGTFTTLAFLTNSLEVSLSATNQNFNTFLFANGSNAASGSSTAYSQQQLSWPNHTPHQDSPREGQEDTAPAASSTAPPSNQGGDVHQLDYPRTQTFYTQ